MNFETDAINESLEHGNLTNIHAGIPSISLQPCASFCDVEIVVPLKDGKHQAPFVTGNFKRNVGFAYYKYLYTANAEILRSK